ncbi:MAG: hypothetical protein ACJ77E_04485 [Gaiellaceae bacterium]
MTVRFAAFVAAAAFAVTGAVLPASARATAAAACGSGANGSTGYAYAGQQAATTAHGVRATITPLALPKVAAGHVGAWIGVGGKAAGPGGADEWLQAGLGALPGGTPFVYAEIQRPGTGRTFLTLHENVEAGESHQLAVLEVKGRPNVWRIWLDGAPATGPLEVAGSSGRWKPMATAESWNGGQSVCNTFSFRFQRVNVATAPGGSWGAFTPGYRFLDHGYVLHQLLPAPKDSRITAGGTLRPYAFDAASAP